MLKYFDPDTSGSYLQGLSPDKDYGTPPVQDLEATELVTLTIDGREISVPRGTSIMRAAAQLGINIPKLCSTDSLQAFGSCRLCLIGPNSDRASGKATTECDGAIYFRSSFGLFDLCS